MSCFGPRRSLTGVVGFTFGLLYLAVDKKLAPVIVAHMVVNALGVAALYRGEAFLSPLIDS